MIAWIGCKQANPPAPKPTPPTTAEAEVFAKELARHASPCDAAALEPLFDLDQMITRALAGRKMSRGEADGFRRGLSRSPLGNLGKTMCQWLEGSSYTYLRTLNIDGTPRPLFRLLGDDGFNYHQLELDKQGRGIRVADISILATGESLSETMRDLRDSLAESDNVTELGAAMKRIQSLTDDKHPREALDLLRTLPADVRASKMVLTVEIQLARSLGDDAGYLEVIERYAKSFPNDPSLDFVRIDSDVLHKQYDAELAAIDRIDKRVGGDPYLDVMRAGAYLELHQPAEAIARARKATEREATMKDAWWMLLSAQAAGKDFTGAIATLEVLRDKFGVRVDPASLGADERFQELVGSKDYRAWSSSPQPR